MYEDTHTLIDDKQAQEEHVVNPLADGDNDDNDVALIMSKLS